MLGEYLSLERYVRFLRSYRSTHVTSHIIPAFFHLDLKRCTINVLLLSMLTLSFESQLLIFHKLVLALLFREVLFHLGIITAPKIFIHKICFFF